MSVGHAGNDSFGAKPAGPVVGPRACTPASAYAEEAQLARQVAITKEINSVLRALIIEGRIVDQAGSSSLVGMTREAVLSLNDFLDATGQNSGIELNLFSIAPPLGEAVLRMGGGEEMTIKKVPSAQVAQMIDKGG